MYAICYKIFTLDCVTKFDFIIFITLIINLLLRGVTMGGNNQSVLYAEAVS